MKQKYGSTQRPAFSLVDSVISLFVVGILIALFGSLANTRVINKRVTFRTTAAALADEEIGALRRLDQSTVATQTDGPCVNVAYNAGVWGVTTDATGGHTAPHALELRRASGFTNALSGRLLFPAGSYGTATLQLKLKVAADSPAGWGFGFQFRSADHRNGYRLRLLDSQTLYLEKISGGVVTNLVAPITGVAFTTNTWHTVSLIMDDTASPKFRFFIDGNQQNAAAIADTTFSSGPAALIGWGGAHLFVDDVQTTTTVTSTWDFDSSTQLPAAWVRVGVNDLPDTTPTTFDNNCTITVAPYPTAAATNLKRAVVTISWLQNGTPLTYTGTTLLGKSTLAQ